MSSAAASPVNQPVSAPQKPQESVRERFLLTAILLVTALAYLPTLRYGFVYDDVPQIPLNRGLLSWASVGHFFRHPIWSDLVVGGGGYYRPGFLTWLLINVKLFGPNNAAAMHLTSVLAHLLATFVFYLLARRLTVSAGISTNCALLATAIFALHPIHAEAIAWISAVNEPLYTAAFLGGIIAYLNWRDIASNARWAWLALSALLLMMALFQKETAVMFVPCIFVIEIAAGRSSSRARRFIGIFVTSVATVVYLLMRMSALAKSARPATSFTWPNAISAVPDIVAFYLRHLFWPRDLALMYDRPYQLHFGAGFFVPLAAIAAFGTAIAIAVRLGWLPRSIALLSAALLFLPLLPVLNIRFFLVGDFCHDRYLYLPSAGYALLLGSLTVLAFERLHLPERIFGLSLPAFAFTALASVLLLIGTMDEIRPYTDDFTLWGRAAAVAPNQVRNLWAFAQQLHLRGRDDEATALLLRANQIAPNATEPLFSLGEIAFEKKDYAHAEALFARCVELRPGTQSHLVYYGETLLAEHRAAEAADAFRRAVTLGQNREIHAALGLALEQMGDDDAALAELRQEMSLFPDNDDARNALSRIEERQSSTAIARKSGTGFARAR